MPRSFVPPILLGGLAYPLSAIAVYMGWIRTKLWTQILGTTTHPGYWLELTSSAAGPSYSLLGFIAPPLPLGRIPLRSSSQVVALAAHTVELSYPILRRKDDTELYGSSYR